MDRNNPDFYSHQGRGSLGNLGSFQGQRQESAFSDNRIYQGLARPVAASADEVVRIARSLNTAINLARANGATVTITVPDPLAPDVPFPEAVQAIAVSVTVTT